MFCPKCGFPYGPDDRFCGRCGAALPDREAHAEQEAVPAEQPAAVAAAPWIWYNQIQRKAPPRACLWLAGVLIKSRYSI